MYSYSEFLKRNETRKVIWTVWHYGGLKSMVQTFKAFVNHKQTHYWLEILKPFLSVIKDQ